MSKYITKLKRPCIDCTELFQPLSNSQMFCQKCRTKKCIVCRSNFTINRRDSNPPSKQRTCSRKCYFADRFKGSGESLVCKKPTIRNKGIYCSRECMRKYWNDKYHKRDKPLFWERKRLLIKNLGGKCIRCGNSDIRCLDINHKDRNKKGKHKNYSWLQRFKEWESQSGNLELLCANCHRLHTWEQMGYAKV